LKENKLVDEHLLLGKSQKQKQVLYSVLYIRNKRHKLSKLIKYIEKSYLY